MFAFGDAVRGALGVRYRATPHSPTGRAGWSGTADRASVTFFSAAARAAVGSATKKSAPPRKSARADPTSASKLWGSAQRRDRKNLARGRCCRGHSPVERRQALKIEVHRIGVRRPLRASRLSGTSCALSGPQAARRSRPASRRDRPAACRTARPRGDCRFRVDELHVDAHAVSAALDAAFEHIAHIELAPDLLHSTGLPLYVKAVLRPITKRARDAREVGREALRHAVDEIAPAPGRRRYWRTAGRRSRDAAGRIFRHRGGAMLRLRRGADVERIDPDRFGDVLELGRAEIGDGEIEPPLDLPIGVLRQADRARLTIPSSRAAILTPSPIRSPSASSTTSPR